MNLADLTAVITVIVGLAGASSTAVSVGAPWWLAILCGLVGLLVGICLALVTGKTAYFLLDSKNRIGFIAYMLFPFVALIGSACLIITGTLLTLDKFGYTTAVASSTKDIQTFQQ